MQSGAAVRCRALVRPCDSFSQTPSECDPALRIRFVKDVNVLDWPPANSGDSLRQSTRLARKRGARRALCLENRNKNGPPSFGLAVAILGVPVWRQSTQPNPSASRRAAEDLTRHIRQPRGKVIAQSFSRNDFNIEDWHRAGNVG
jgi:hypothetical protein